MYRCCFCKQFCSNVKILSLHERAFCKERRKFTDRFIQLTKKHNKWLKDAS